MENTQFEANQQNVNIGGDCSPERSKTLIANKNPSFSFILVGDFVCNGIKYINPIVKSITANVSRSG